MAIFGRRRDIDVIIQMNRELMGDIITQQASIYKYKLGETNSNIYGEASSEKFYDGPFIFDCLINRSPQQYAPSDIGINLSRIVEFYFLREDLRDKQVLVEPGDIILYEERYYEIDTVTQNQYFVGKDPDYPNNENPLNPGLEQFGNNLSVLCTTHYVPADKLAISRNKERF